MGYWPSKTKNQDIVVFYCHIQDSFSLGENDYYFPVKYDYSLTVNTGLVQRPLVILGTSPPSSFFNNRSSQLLAKSMTTVWIPYLEGRCGNMVSSRLKGYEQNNTCHFGSSAQRQRHFLKTSATSFPIDWNVDVGMRQFQPHRPDITLRAGRATGQNEPGFSNDSVGKRCLSSSRLHTPSLLHQR